MVIAYITDQWHSNASKEVIAVSDDPDFAIELCQQKAKRLGFKLTPQDIENLENFGQSQSSGRDTEFMIEGVYLNKLIK